MQTTTPAVPLELLTGPTYTYNTYRNLVDELLAKGQTTGNNHSEAMLHYTRMNQQRMKRWDKTAQVPETFISLLVDLKRPQHWLILTEAWCGDAAQSIPFLAKLAEVSERISLDLVLRDQNTALMAAFLTNGAQSIPKLIACDAQTGEVCFTWGPRPALLQEKVLAYKANPAGQTQEEFIASIHRWYTDNKNQAIAAEFEKLLKPFTL
ncbi:MAG: thioredoxin family protein [Nitritalea sp.]